MKGGSAVGRRSESDKEKTKMRERKRRAITTNIFHGLRKHGGYPLSPRADINEVFRQLAHEAGWVILPDGTTHRAKVSSGCPLCGAPRETAAAASHPAFNGDGKCSTIALGAAALTSIKAGSSLFCFSDSLSGSCHQPISIPVHTDHELTGEAQSGSSEGGPYNSDGGIVESSGMTMITCDLSRSNQRTTMGSPPCCP